VAKSGPAILSAFSSAWHVRCIACLQLQGRLVDSASELAVLRVAGLAAHGRFFEEKLKSLSFLVDSASELAVLRVAGLAAHGRFFEEKLKSLSFTDTTAKKFIQNAR
jgi:hypothetical protein